MLLTEIGKPLVRPSETCKGLSVPGVESSSSGLMTNDEEDSMSELYQSLSHSKWEYKYHVVFVSKLRRKAIFGQARRQLGAIFHALARQKDAQIIESHLIPDHRANAYRHSLKHP